MTELQLSDGHIIGGMPYIVAEVNSSHGGDYDTALRMIDAAKAAGCDCVKFQSWSAESLYSKTYYKENPIAKRFVQKFSLSPEQLLTLSDYCRTAGIAFSSTPYSCEEVDFLADCCRVPFIKIASMELNHDKFLQYIALKGLPVFLSTGMGTAEEVAHAVDVIEKTGNHQICLLHCISIYPCSPSEVNLKNLLWLQKEYPRYVIGFSDHSIGTELACGAVALGARVIEKHLTLDKNKIGMDNQMATEPEEMAHLTAQCRNVFQALGQTERIVSPKELEQRRKMRRSLIFTRDLPAGHILTEQDISAKRPADGFAPAMADTLVGKKTARAVSADTLILPEDIVL